MRQAAEAAERQGKPAAGSRRRIAVLVPCYNEEAAIARVVADFDACLPDAVIYVYDNNSTDRTAEAARAAGATVRREPRQGKGHVVRRMFADVEADIYVLVDGDATYDAPSVRAMIARPVEGGLDLCHTLYHSQDAPLSNNSLHYHIYHHHIELGNDSFATFPDSSADFTSARTDIFRELAVHRGSTFSLVIENNTTT